MTAFAESVTLLEDPPRPELPLFDYGLFKPDQLAYDHLLSGLVVGTEAARLPTGALRYRDGLPLLDPEGPGGVEGVLVRFGSGKERAGYQAVCSAAPRQHYRWLTTRVHVDGDGEVAVNTLLGRHPTRGSAEEWFRTWSAAEEPVFGPGIHVVRSVALEQAGAPFPLLAGDSPPLWERFFALHGAYLTLFSAVDRFAALALGPAEPSLPRLYRLGEDPRFRECVIAAGVLPSPKSPDSRDPQKWRRIRPDGSGAMYSWESLRSCLGHPGATAHHDGVALRRALVELHDSFRLLLLTRLPEVARAWSRLDPDGETSRWLLRPVVSPEGLG
jgi:hypothetical protein